ncbi:hypothetical protein U9M48_016739 [Paspalum notatum var. saurae]|uniref:protein O-GlcNAc transferase n=1 Tax=Paspalum notatum var. saurae TaxID=547442 RepID=A0AAQ3T785_PASNO
MHLEIAQRSYNAGDYRAALEQSNALYMENPGRLENLLLLGAAYYQLGQFDMCIAKNEEAVAIQPNFPESFNNMANAWREKGDIDRAIQCYEHAIQAYTYFREAIRIAPTCASAWCNIAGIFMQWGDFNKAVLYYKEAIKLKPTFYDAHMNLGNLYKVVGMCQDAIVSFQNAAQASPHNAVAYGNLGDAYYEQGQLDLAILSYRHATNCNPSYVEAYNNLTCLALQPNHPQALTNLGNVYMERSMLDIAVSHFMAALAVTTRLSAAYNNWAMIYKQQSLVNRGNTFKEAGRVSEAIQDYLQASVIKPTMAKAHANLACAYKETGLMELAIVSYKQALQLCPDFPEVTCNLLHALQCVCDWDDREEKFTKRSLPPSVQPLHAMAFPFDPTLALEISKKYADHYSLVASRFGLPAFTHASRTPMKSDDRASRLRIGYLSSDFGNHPLSHLMGSVFGMHNKDIVEVFCYALSQDDGTEWRQRVKVEAEHFIDVSAMPSDMIAKVINEVKIQILINLNGYTKGARNEVFAMQPAPIQVSYMGFPATTGASYIDYLITDEFVSPLEYSHIYSEKLVHLPHCYFVNDYKQLYKMDPDIFNTWCNILKRVPNSVLWLLRFPAAGEMRLRAYAISKGVRPDQIIFTDVAAKNEHIRRSALADLFLDTLKEYEERAVFLAMNPPELQTLTSRLRAVRKTCPLFDTSRWVKNLDRAYLKMWHLYCSGSHPQHFKVVENDTGYADCFKPDPAHVTLPSEV